ncbi:MAG: HlyD family efflux transporter periplasmic adaptor subunit [Planctomycetota bacterium]|nr:MAG: HlyD family efflux transporter periplasmic adaptor subunit [Planctomycetota bacterium]
MNCSKSASWRRWLPAGAALLLCPLAGCDRQEPERVQGYIEGEFVYVASSQAGALEALHVQRGAQVQAGDPLFALEDTPEQAARDEASDRLALARASLEDLRKGQRPSEIAAVEARLGAARAALVLAESELLRQEGLVPSGAAAAQDLERAHAARERERQRVAQLEAELETARLGSRADQVAAAEAEVAARADALARAEWALAQKRQDAPQAALVFDTLYRAGEWVAAGRPVVALLPAQNIKLRAFVPETEVGALQVGQPVQVLVDGVPEPFPGRLSFISPEAEFTPPVIYSRESRAKLVFRIEAVFDPEIAARLHPGQPVDVQLRP